MPRINIYHHETEWMANRGAEIVTKVVADTGLTFYGVRFYTEDVREHEPGDDDSAAVTIWLPWSRADGHNVTILMSLAQDMIDAADGIMDQIDALNPFTPRT